MKGDRRISRVPPDLAAGRGIRIETLFKKADPRTDGLENLKKAELQQQSRLWKKPPKDAGTSGEVSGIDSLYF
jgi:hypothetical protein